MLFLNSELSIYAPVHQSCLKVQSTTTVYLSISIPVNQYYNLSDMYKETQQQPGTVNHGNRSNSHYLQQLLFTVWCCFPHIFLRLNPPVVAIRNTSIDDGKAALEFPAMVFVHVIVGRDNDAVGELASSQGLLCLLAVYHRVELHVNLKYRQTGSGNGSMYSPTN